MNRKRKKTTSNNTETVSVTRNESVISIFRMDHPACATRFLRQLQDGIDKGIRSYEIKWCGDVVYPDACVPIAGIIAFYRENHHIDFTYDISNKTYLQSCAFMKPIVQDAKQLKDELFPFDKIYRYSDSAQVAALTQAYIDCLSRTTECSDGVLVGLTWCINEVMDNVLLHSEAGHGFVMVQYHQGNKTIAICVYDSGIGIYKSLKKSKHKPRTCSDAISLAIQEGIGDGKGQGNGLFGLYQVIHENKGSLAITSGRSSVMWTSSQEMKKFDYLPSLSEDYAATSIDFRLNLENTIDIQSAFSSIGGFDGFDVRIDDMLQDDDSCIYDVYKSSTGTATREAGEFLRNDVLNIITRTKARITLDFQGVKTVSSSFADEFIAKLVLRLGFIQFNQLIRLVNMNDDVRFLIERSLYMRVHEEWEARKHSGQK